MRLLLVLLIFSGGFSCGLWHKRNYVYTYTDVEKLLNTAYVLGQESMILEAIDG